MNSKNLGIFILILLLLTLWRVFLHEGGFVDSTSPVSSASVDHTLTSNVIYKQCVNVMPRVIEGPWNDVCPGVAKIVQGAEENRGVSVALYVQRALIKCVALRKQEGMINVVGHCRKRLDLEQTILNDALALMMCDAERAVIQFTGTQQYFVKRGFEVYMNRKVRTACQHQIKQRASTRGFIRLRVAYPDIDRFPKPAERLLAAIQENKQVDFLLWLKSFDWARHPYAHLRVMNKAVVSNNPYYLKKLLEYEIPVNVPVDYYNQPLANAVRYGSELAVVSLLQKGARLDYSNEAGELPLLGALRRGYRGAVGLMLLNGADVEGIVGDDFIAVRGAPLDEVMKRGDWMMERLLLSHGAKGFTRAPHQ